MNIKLMHKVAKMLDGLPKLLNDKLKYDEYTWFCLDMKDLSISCDALGWACLLVPNFPLKIVIECEDNSRYLFGRIVRSGRKRKRARHDDWDWTDSWDDIAAVLGIDVGVAMDTFSACGSENVTYEDVAVRIQDLIRNSEAKT